MTETERETPVAKRSAATQHDCAWEAFGVSLAGMDEAGPRPAAGFRGRRLRDHAEIARAALGGRFQKAFARRGATRCSKRS